jgi:uncharacterized membrane protein YcfT
MSDAPARSRLPWADVAKGSCILLVVLHHVVTKHAVLAFPAGPVLDGWLWVSMALKPVRMPLFFVISGFFAASAVRRPWSLARRRVTSPLYLYVVWLLLLGGIFAVERTLPMNRTQDLGELLADLVLPSTGLWFLHALAVYFLAARWLVRFPRHLVLLGATGFAAVAAALPIEEVNRSAALVHFVYFAVGALYPDAVRRVTEPRPGAWLPELTAVYLLAVLTLAGTGLPADVQALALGPLGVLWGLRVAMATSSRGRPSAALGWLGRRTLPVYVLHVPVLAAVHHLLARLGVAPAGVVAPLLVTAVVTAGSLLVHAVLLRAGLGVLFAPPRRSDLRATTPIPPMGAQPAGT